ncbi:MAG: hypothetical protein NT033_07190 [Candidatus Omnitrophica bacterium]|nr:hypothetical protein [Candidatus Omnitrophota bacterium]
MNKIEALTSFLMGLQMSLNNAAYFRGHPYLIKSAESFKEKTEVLFSLLNPIEIVVSTESLFLDGKSWNKPALFVDLARTLHQRKIKSIVFRQGVTLDELISFLNAASLSVKDTAKSGGIKKLLLSKKTPHIEVREIDYSYLLEASAEECEEALSTFGDPAQEKDPRKVTEFSNNFGIVMGKFKDKDLLHNEELKRNISNFLQHLKTNQKDKFDKCATEVYRSVTKYESAIKGVDTEKAAELFKNLNEQDMARILLDEISTSENFDALSFQFFLRVAGEKRSTGIPDSLLNQASDNDTLKDNSKVAKNIQNLLSGANSQSISDVYRNTLSVLLKKVTFGQGKAFDRVILDFNYRFILLGLLTQERDREKLRSVCKKLSQEWPAIAADKDWEYIKNLFDTIYKRKRAEADLGEIFSDIEKSISLLIESLAWEGEEGVLLAYFIDNLESANLDAQFYLDKVFKEHNSSPYGLRLFLRFFPGRMTTFCDLLAGERFNTEFIIKIIDGLKRIDSFLIIDILKYIYPVVDQIVKVEILRAMSFLSKIDEEFLFSVLTSDDVSLRKEAAQALSKYENTKEKMLDMLLGISSSWGFKNRIIMDNMNFVEETGLRQAGQRLLALSRRHFFWNRKIRKRAQEILHKWQT